jgi:hypothetical protein
MELSRKKTDLCGWLLRRNVPDSFQEADNQKYLPPVMRDFRFLYGLACQTNNFRKNGFLLRKTGSFTAI